MLGNVVLAIACALALVAFGRATRHRPASDGGGGAA
jgi:hypothetical protein